MMTGWQEILLFCVVFHAVRHLTDNIQDKRGMRRIERALREMSKIERELEAEKLRRVK
jgi:hypothetical protein